MQIDNTKLLEALKHLGKPDVEAGGLMVEPYLQLRRQTAKDVNDMKIKRDECLKERLKLEGLKGL